VRTSRFFWKLYLGYVVLILVTTASVVFFVGRHIETEVLEESERTVRSHALMFRELAPPALLDQTDPETSSFQEELRRLGVLTGVRYTYIRDDGLVLADSHQDPAVMDDHSTRPEVLEARRSGMGMATRFSASVERRMMYLAIPVRSDGGGKGFVRTALALSAIDRRLATLRKGVALAAAVAVLAALAIGLVVVRQFTAPLVRMSETARSIASGRYERRLEVPGRDEMGAFALSFNLMASQLQERIEGITDERNRLLAILAGMVEGVVAVDGDGCILHMNAVAGRILGTDPDKAVGRRLGAVTRVQEVEEALTGTMRSGVERSREILLPTQDRVLAIRSGPIGKGSDVSGAVVVLHDVTELRRLEAVRRDFVANVSHELKTPLTVVRGIVETLLDDAQMAADTRERFLHKVSDQAERLSAIVTDLLTLARAESSPEVFEREPHDLRWLAEESYRALAPSAESKGVALRIDLAPEPVPVRGDRSALRLVIDNLLDNAVKYTPSKGDVTVRVWNGDRYANLVVTDTGIGIAEHEQERIFERFYRVDKARSRDLGGTGLGLSIVKHMVQVHGGDVGVESAPGVGSSFRVRIPLDSSYSSDVATSN
jgi:two-component system phosphate regulon sensor histidine kinase PhoR